MAKAQPRPQRKDTKGKRADEALRESEERLHLVVSSAPIVLFAFDRDGICTLSEGKGLEALGLKPGEFVGRSVFDLLAGTSHEQSLRRALAGEASTTVSQFTGRTLETHCVPLQDGDGQVAGAIGVAIDITERAQAEEALRESEAKYRQIFENEQDIYYRTNIRGIITEISPSVERFGYTREELIGTSVMAIYEMPGERSSLPRQILERGEVSDYEIRMKAADGRLIDGSLSAHIVRDAGGAPIGFEGSIRNISRRKQAEEALHKSEERLRLLASNAPVTLFALDRDGVITLSEGKGLEAVGLKPGEQVGLSLFDAFPNLPNVGERFDRVLAGETATFTVESNGQALDVHCAPARNQDGEISGIIGVAINVTERKQAEDALRDSEEKYRQIFENVQDVYFRTDIESTIKDISPSVQRYGYTREELIGTSALAFYESADSRSALLNALLQHGGVTDYEIRMKSARGPMIDGSLSARLLRGPDGAPIGLEGFIRDITERKRVEEALKESEARYHHIFDNVQDIYYRTDAQGIFTDISRSVEQFGYTPEEMIGTPATDIYANPEERQGLLAAILEHRLVTDYEVHLKTKAGETRVDSVSSHILLGPNGEFAGIEGTVRDITERKRMEEALRESEAKYRQIFENVQDICYRTNIQGTITEISPSVERYGYTREKLVGTSILAIYDTPEERSRLVKVILKRGEVTDYEIRVKAADGRVIDGSLSAHLLRDRGGAPIGFEGSIRNITDRKRMEQALRDSEEKFRHIFDNVQDIYYRTDAQGIITDISPSIQRYGYPHETLIGRPVLDVYPDPDERSGLLKALLESKSGAVVDHAVQLRAADGRLIDASVSAHLLRGPDGEFAGVEGALRDVTERKQADEAQREREARYRHIFDNVQDIYYRTDAQGIFTDISRSVEQFGYTTDELIGTPATDVYANPEERQALLAAILEHGLVTDFEVHLKTKAGETRVDSVSSHALLGPNGEFAGIEGTLRDITERKRMEEALRESEERLRAVITNVPVMLFALDREGVFTLSEGKGLEALGLKPGELVGVRAFERFPALEGMGDYVRRALDGEAFTTELELAGFILETHCAPLRDHSGQITGMIGVATDITQRKRMEEALRDSEQKFHRIFENAPEAYYRTDAQGIVTDVSQSIERYGWPREEIIGKQVLDFYGTPEERSALLQALLKSGEVADHEIHLTAADGRVIDTSVCTYALRGPNGEFAGVEGTLRDVSERKRMEKALRESEEKYRQIFDHVQDIYYQTDGRGTITEISASVGHFGYTPEELIGTPVQKLYKNPKERLALVQKLVESGVVTDFEIHLKTKGGIQKTASVSAHVLRGPDGEFAGSEGSIRDITERKRTEEALKKTAAELQRSNDTLRETEEKFHRIFDNVQDIYYRTDDKGIITEISPSVRRFGNDPDALVGTPVLEMYKDPDERSALMKLLFEQGVVIDFEVHLRSGDGLDRTTSVSTHLLRGPNGEFLGVEGSLRDVTERKRMEKELRESEAKYRGIFENVQDIYYVTDDRGIITEISPSISRYGYAREDLVGTPVLDVYQSPEERSALLQAVLEREAVGDYEVHLRTGDGRVIPTSVSTHVIRGPNGEFLGVEGSLRDISERKRMEEALREQARRDPLTGALNHGTIVDELRKLISSGSDGPSHAVAMVDVDGLKAINDTYGHQVGDAVLVAVAGGLARDGAIIGRYGGDEFVVLLPNTDREAAESYRQRVLDSLAEVDLRDSETGSRIQLIASVGLAIFPTEAGRIEELIKLADSAMYAWRRQRPVLSAGSTLSRAQGGDRAAKMVGQIVPLLTSLDDLNDKLRLVAHRLSVGADYDAVNFVLFRSEGVAQGGLTSIARMPEELVERWSRAQRRAKHNAIREIQERTHRAIIMDDPQNDERFTEEQRELMRAAELRSVLIAPMVWRDELIGHLSVASKREGAFGPRDAEFLVAVATQVTAITRLATLVEDLQSTSNRLEQGHTETVVLLAAAAEAHDHHTGLHLRSVRSITEALAFELGYSEEYAEELGLAAVLHDIGKIRVPDVVLSTAGQLTDEEWDLMKQHTVWGEDFLSERPGFELAAIIARSHHERWDGSGYPDGLVGKSIPTAATIVSVADAFDAMVNDRPYRSARSVAAAVREIVSCSGAQFSPKVVQALARLHKQKKLVRLHREALADLAA